MGQSIKRNSRKWQCDELPVDFPLGEQAMRGLVLHEPRPHALLVQPVEQEEIVARKGLFDEVSAIAAAISMPLTVAFITVRDWNQELSP